MPGWRNGRRGGLKIRYPRGCGGSSPFPGTTFSDAKSTIQGFRLSQVTQGRTTALIKMGIISAIRTAHPLLLGLPKPRHDLQLDGRLPMEYKSPVMPMLLRPNRSHTTFRCTPLASINDVCVCLKRGSMEQNQTELAGGME